MNIKIILLIACSFSFAGSASAQFKLYERGHDSYKAGEYDKAVSSLTEYLKFGTRDKALDIEVFYIRALSYYKSSQYQKAIPDFEETILLNHKNKGNIYWFLAKCHVNLQQKGDAIEYYNSALRELSAETEPRAKLLFERSQIYSGLGQIQMAFQDVTHAKELMPQNREIVVEHARLEKEFAKINNVSQASATQPKEDVASNNKKSKSSPASKKKSDSGAKVTTSKQDDDSAPPVTLASDPGTVTTPAAVVSNVPATTTTTVATTVPGSIADQYKDEKRFALIIGNSKYSQKIGVLRNPENDASDIAVELKASNFDVVLLTNATYGQIRAALLKFKDKIDAGEKEKTVALFYYAGHGLAFEDENFIVPVDAEVEYQDDIPRYCFPIQRMVLSNMERSNSRMNIVILDACRNNPFPVATRSAGNGGLGEMKRARGSFIAYATSPGSVASDGNGRNGLYTQELLKSLKKPGLTIEQVFKDVRINVLKLSNDRQNTWDSSNITGEFYFKF